MVAGCSSPPVTDNGGDEVVASSPAEAVELVVDFLSVPDFDSAAQLSYPRHAALASLAEGASFEEVALALREGDMAVAANFWSGFAQGSGNFLKEGIDVAAAPPVSQGSVEFGVASVVSPEVGERAVLTRVIDGGHHVDLFASFGGGLAGMMIAPVETLLAAQTDDAALILSELRLVVPSLLVASRHPWLPAEVVLDLSRLVELITRSA